MRLPLPIAITAMHVQDIYVARPIHLKSKSAVSFHTKSASLPGIATTDQFPSMHVSWCGQIEPYTNPKNIEQQIVKNHISLLDCIIL
jgi:hypothetical protein